MIDYVATLREGILEAYTGIVTGLKNTDKGMYIATDCITFSLSNITLLVVLLLPHVQAILELVQRSLADEERSDNSVKLSLGLIGDLADAFPAGQIKQHLLSEWVAQALRSKGRFSAEAKKTLRWAREVSRSMLYPNSVADNLPLIRWLSAQRRSPMFS